MVSQVELEPAIQFRSRSLRNRHSSLFGRNLPQPAGPLQRAPTRRHNRTAFRRTLIANVPTVLHVELQARRHLHPTATATAPELRRHAGLRQKMQNERPKDVSQSLLALFQPTQRLHQQIVKAPRRLLARLRAKQNLETGLRQGQPSHPALHALETLENVDLTQDLKIARVPVVVHELNTIGDLQTAAEFALRRARALGDQTHQATSRGKGGQNLARLSLGANPEDHALEFFNGHFRGRRKSRPSADFQQLRHQQKVDGQTQNVVGRGDERRGRVGRIVAQSVKQDWHQRTNQT